MGGDIVPCCRRNGCRMSAAKKLARIREDHPTALAAGSTDSHYPGATDLYCEGEEALQKAVADREAGDYTGSAQLFRQSLDCRRSFRHDIGPDNTGSDNAPGGGYALGRRSDLAPGFSGFARWRWQVANGHSKPGSKCDGDHIGLRRRWNIVRHPPMEEVDSALAHVGIKSHETLGSANP